MERFKDERNTTDEITTTTAAAPTEKNPYLALRQAKIARNQARLRELGLLSSSSSSSSLPKTTARASLASSLKKKRKIQNNSDPEENPKTLVVRRRSRRLSSKQHNAKDQADEVVTTRITTHPRQRQGGIQKADDRSSSLLVTPSPQPPPPPPRTTTTTTTTHRPKAAISPNSVRGMSLDVARLVMGNNDTTEEDKGLLGVPLKKTGKEFVVYESFGRAATIPGDDEEQPPPERLSFNKYSGVQEWKNTLFLWVNLGTLTTPNEFLENGRQITWFGGSRMVNDQHPTIQRLIRAGRRQGAKSSMKNHSESNNDNDNHNHNEQEQEDSIILWCRWYQPQTKTFGPYICMGRLSYHSHQPDSYPLAFIWTLSDYDELSRRYHPTKNGWSS